SSAAMRSTSARTRSARSVTSSRFPIGVATTYKTPPEASRGARGRRGCGGFVTRERRAAAGEASAAHGHPLRSRGSALSGVQTAGALDGAQEPVEAEDEDEVR